MTKSQNSPTDSTESTERIPPLNLTADEAMALWEMVKVGIGDADVYEKHREDVESVHTKVRRLVKDDD